MRHVLTLMSGDPDVIDYLPPFEQEKWFHFRFQAIRAEAGDLHRIDPLILKDLREFALTMMRRERIVMNAFGGSIDLEEFLTIGFTVIIQLKVIKPESFSTAPHFIVGLAPYITSAARDKSWEHCLRVMEATAIVHSDLATCLYWTTVKVEMHFEKHEFYNALKVFKHVQEKIPVTFDGITRPAVRVGWGDAEKGIVWCARPPAAFGLPQRNLLQTIPIYIQMHALQRLSERLDCIDRGTVHYFVYKALTKGHIHITEENDFLIEFHFYDMKAGYLLTSLFNDILVVRTFLLLTNNGTPEGKKLHNLTGLRKHDKKYLSLDKLSTFMDPRLRADEAVQRLFFDAGCSDLFEITEDLVYDPSVLQSHVSAKALLDYLKVQHEKDKQKNKMKDKKE